MGTRNVKSYFIRIIRYESRDEAVSSFPYRERIIGQSRLNSKTRCNRRTRVGNSRLLTLFVQPLDGVLDVLDEVQVFLSSVIDTLDLRYRHQALVGHEGRVLR